MNTLTNRSVFRFLVGSIVYASLLWVTFSLTADYYVLRGFPYGPLQVTAWFSLVSAFAAFSAAAPIGVVLRCWPGILGTLWILLLGAACGVLVAAYGVVGYGLPTRLSAWIVEAANFASISLAPLIVVKLFSRRPLTGVGAGRDK